MHSRQLRPGDRVTAEFMVGPHDVLDVWKRCDGGHWHNLAEEVTGPVEEQYADGNMTHRVILSAVGDPTPIRLGITCDDTAVWTRL